MTELLNTETHTPVLLMNHLGSLREVADLGKHSVYTHFPKDPKLRDLPEDQDHKGPVQKTYWQCRTSCRKFRWFDYTRSQSSQWKLWIWKQSSIGSRGARLGHTRNPVVSVQHKNFSGNTKGACKSSWNRIGSLKSFTLTIPENLAKHVKILPGLFLGYALYAEVTYWLQTLRSWKRWTHQISTQKKTQFKGSNISPKKMENSFFPVAGGRIKLSGGDQDLRTSTLIRHRPNSRRE